MQGMNSNIIEISFVLQSVNLKLVLLHNPWSYFEVVDNINSHIDECSFSSIFCGAAESQILLINRGFTITFRHTTLCRTAPDGGQSDAERPLPDITQHSPEPDVHAISGIRTYNPGKRADADPLHRPRGQWDRLWAVLKTLNNQNKVYLKLYLHLWLFMNGDFTFFVSLAWC
jgi:hypothetical protein